MLEKVKMVMAGVKVLIVSSFVFMLLSGAGTTVSFAAQAPGGKTVSKSSTVKKAKTKTKTKTTKKYTKRSKKRKVARTRKDMILEIEMKAIKEALAIKTDQEKTSRFATKAGKEYINAQKSANEAREMLGKASETLSATTASKDTAVAAIERAKVAAEEARALADKAKKEAKLAGLDTTTYTTLRAEAKKEVLRADAREASALAVLKQARSKEQYYRNLVKRRIRNAEDFYYIAQAAIKKGGNAQGLEFAIKAKAEMEQAKIAENEAAIRGEATIAAEKVVEARTEGTETARVKSRALAKLLKISQEIGTTLTEAYEAAKLSASAARKVLARTQDFAASKDEILAFSNRKVESLTNIKNATERKEVLASSAAQAAQAVVAAKQKAQAEAEARAHAALSSARVMVIREGPVVPAGAQGQAQPEPNTVQ